jgi:hypothetical protein
VGRGEKFHHNHTGRVVVVVAAVGIHGTVECVFEKAKGEKWKIGGGEDNSRAYTPGVSVWMNGRAYRCWFYP